MSISSTVIGICTVFVQRRWKIDPIDLPAGRSIRSIFHRWIDLTDRRSIGSIFPPEDRSDRSSVRDATCAQIRFRIRAENCEQGGRLRRKSEVCAFMLLFKIIKLRIFRYNLTYSFCFPICSYVSFIDRCTDHFGIGRSGAIVRPDEQWYFIGHRYII